jgi:hypothetical protein
MTGIDEKFWDAAITEAATNRRPPDQVHDIMLRLQVPELDQPAVDGRPTARRVFRLRRVLEFAAAAALLLAIGVATGLIPLGPEQHVDDPAAVPREVASAPGTEFERLEDHIELKHGWLLVTTGTPDVHCNGSVLSQVDGRVLVHASGVPSRGQAEAVTGWLEANRLELEMVGGMKNWARGTTLAALVLSGSAMLDGQKIEGPKPEATATTEWQVVRSVMDIDNLPKGTRFVNADGLNAAHLDFLAEVPTLEAISMRWAVDLRLDHLQSLKALKKLEWLDIRGAWWRDRVVSPEGLAELPALRRLGADLVPYGLSSNEFSYTDVTLPVLKDLAGRGVEIELGEWDPPSQDALKEVLDALPTLRGIVISQADAGEMKMLAAHKNLRSIELEQYNGDQIGLAYLARKATLEELSIETGALSLDQVHQISRMKLRFLRLEAPFTDSPQMCFELIAGMENLRELELHGLGIDESGWAAFEKFQGMHCLDRLLIGYEAVAGYGVDFLLARHVPTRRLELAGGQLEIPEMGNTAEVLENGQAGGNIEVIVFKCHEAQFQANEVSDAQTAALKSYPNLKRIEVQRGGFENPSMQDQFVNWLKANLPGVEVVVTP